MSDNITPPLDLITVEDAAATLMVTPTSVRRWIRSGDLRAAKFGNTYRIDRADLVAFYASRVSA